MKKILCPTDFSNSAQNAIAYAAKFAKATQASLTLLNVQPTTSAVLVNDPGQDIISITGQMEELRREVQKSFKISCDAEVLQSGRLLSDALAERGNDFDMIVMGTHGVGNTMEFFAGSNTYHAIRKSATPVLLIPSDCTYSEIRSMVYAYDYLNARKLPIRQLQQWIKSIDAEVTVLQVNEEAISQDVLDEMQELQSIISEECKNDDVSIAFDSIRSAEIAPSIHSYMQRNESDVLALCTKDRNFIQQLFHKSVIKVISEIAGYPVLVFHE